MSEPAGTSEPGKGCPWVDGQMGGEPADGTRSVRVAIAGKGGSGKTTIAGTLARILAQSGRDVLAIDADTNPNLSATLGVPPDAATRITSLPRSLMKRETHADGTVTSTFTADPEEVLRQYGAAAPDNVRLLVMGAVGHGGAG